ncbi:MAG: (2Fe-2S)-binding protein [Candidatus Babeliales bacterium]
MGNCPNKKDGACCQQNNDDYLVCTCMGVMHSEIIEAIHAGARDFQALQDQLMVGTGCSSCVAEIMEILAQCAKKD